MKLCFVRDYENWKNELNYRKSKTVATNYNKKKMPLFQESNYIHIKMLELLITLCENDELKLRQSFNIYHDVHYEWTKMQKIAAVLASGGRTEKVTELTDDEVIEAKRIAKEKIDKYFEGY